MMQQVSVSSPFERNKKRSYKADVFGDVLHDFDIWGYQSFTGNNGKPSSSKEFEFDGDDWTAVTESSFSTGRSSLENSIRSSRKSIANESSSDALSRQSFGQSQWIEPVKIRSLGSSSSSKSANDDGDSHASSTIVSKSVRRRNQSSRKDSRTRRQTRPSQGSLEQQLSKLPDPTKEERSSPPSVDEYPRRRLLQRTSSASAKLVLRRQLPKRGIERSKSLVGEHFFGSHAKELQSCSNLGVKIEAPTTPKRKLVRSISAKNVSLTPTRAAKRDSVHSLDMSSFAKEALLSPHRKSGKTVSASSSRLQRGSKRNSPLSETLAALDSTPEQ